MKSLIKSLHEFSSSTHEAHPVYVNDLLDEELVEQLKEYYQTPTHKRTEKQHIAVTQIQAKLLTQMGIFAPTNNDEDPLRLAYIIPVKQKAATENDELSGGYKKAESPEPLHF